MSLTKAHAARQYLIDCSWSWSFSSVKVRSANQTLAEEQPWPPRDPHGPRFAMRRLRSARATSGSYTNCWDTADIHNLYHYDGSEWSGTLQEFFAMTGKRLVWQGGNHLSVAGWYLRKEDAERHHDRFSEKARRIAASRGDIRGASNPRHDPTIYEFWNHITGDRVSCTRHDLCVRYGIGYGCMSAVLSGKRQSVKGWSLWSRRNEKFRRPETNITFKKDGRTISGSRAEVAALMGTAPANVSYGIYSIRSGKSKNYKGWKLIEKQPSDQMRTCTGRV